MSSDKMRTVPVLTHFLEMRGRPDLGIRTPVEGLNFRKVDGISNDDYRKLYLSVGEAYDWFDRVLMDDGELRSILDSDYIEIYLLTLKGEVVGYTELDTTYPRNVEIVFLGIRKKFHGLGFGKYLLEKALEMAWKEDTGRVWLHTCEWDHERALDMYLKMGFVKYREDKVLQKVPDDHERFL